MNLILFALFAMVLGACCVGLVAALAVWRDELNPDRHYKVRAGKPISIVFALIILVITILLFAFPPCS